jgi:hypothetical protein
MPTYGSVNISKGYYNNGTDTIISSDTQASLSDLKTGQTVGCKNTLFMTSASGTVAPYISSNNAPTGTFDVYAALNTPIYLNWTKEYIAGGAEITPDWSFINSIVNENYNVVGSPTIRSDYVASGFSSSNYLKPSQVFNPGSSTWEVNAKILTGNDLGLNWIFQSCVGEGQSNRYGLSCYISDGKFALAVSSGTSSWLFDQQGTYSVQTSTTYWIKFGWNGEKYYLEYSTDGNTFTRDIEYSSTTAMTSSIVYSFIGIFSTYGYQGPFTGSIYLTELYTKVNNVETWRAVQIIPTSLKTQKALVYDNANDKTFWYPSETSSDLKDFIAKADKNDLFYTNKTGQPTSDIVVSGNGTTYVKNFTEIGTPTVSSNFDVSGFEGGALAVSKCVSTSVTLDPTLPWEINCKFTTGVMGSSGTPMIIGRGSSVQYTSPNIYINNPNRKLTLIYSLNGTSYVYLASTNENVVADNTTYWVKAEFTGSKYNLYISTDGVSFNLLRSVSSSNVMNVVNPMPIYFGARHNDTTQGAASTLINGTIHMKDCNIISNGIVIWRGAEGYIADSSKKDEKSVWLNHAHDKIIGIGTEPDEVELEVSSNNDEVVASQDHYWTYLGNTSYDEQGQSMAASSMTGSIGSGYMMLNPNGTLAFTDATSAYQYVGGNAFSGYTIRFTDNTHTEISSLTNQSSTKCRVYARLSGSSYAALYTAMVPPTGDIKSSVTNTDGKLEIAPSGTIQEGSYTYDATNDTISIEGSIYSYIGDFYAII